MRHYDAPDNEWFDRPGTLARGPRSGVAGCGHRIRA
jgi:hypothetical protein